MLIIIIEVIKNGGTDDEITSVAEKIIHGKI